jgi:hypothetical protein
VGGWPSELMEADELEAYGHHLNDLVQVVDSVLLVRSAQLEEDLLSTGWGSRMQVH